MALFPLYFAHGSLSQSSNCVKSGDCSQMEQFESHIPFQNRFELHSKQSLLRAILTLAVREVLQMKTLFNNVSMKVCLPMSASLCQASQVGRQSAG